MPPQQDSGVCTLLQLSSRIAQPIDLMVDGADYSFTACFKLTVLLVIICAMPVLSKCTLEAATHHFDTTVCAQLALPPPAQLR